jgi:hypothetical protein
MSFDCHGHPIILPAELDGVFSQPPTFIHFHEVMEQLDPAFKEIVTILRQEGPTRYLSNYNADFIIRDYITFISRKAPSGKNYWEGYDDGPRKHSFVHCQCSGFMAYLARPETKAQLQRRAQEIDARSKAKLAAGRKNYAQVMADPKGYRTTPTQAANSTAEIIIEQAERRAQKIVEEAHRLGKEIIRQARRGNPGRPTAAHPDPDEEPIRFREDGDDGA